MNLHNTVINNYWGKASSESQGVIKVSGGSNGASFVTNVSSDELITNTALLAFMKSELYTDVTNISIDLNLQIRIRYTDGRVTLLSGPSSAAIDLSLRDVAVTEVFVVPPDEVKITFSGRQPGEVIPSRRDLVLDIQKGNGAITKMTTLAEIGRWINSIGILPNPVLSTYNTAPVYSTSAFSPDDLETELDQEAGLELNNTGVGGRWYLNAADVNATVNLAALGFVANREFSYYLNGTVVRAKVASIAPGNQNWFVVTGVDGTALTEAQVPPNGTFVRTFGVIPEGGARSSQGVKYQVAFRDPRTKGLILSRNGIVATTITDLETGDILQWTSEGETIDLVIGFISDTGSGYINVLGKNNTVITDAQLPPFGVTLTKFEEPVASEYKVTVTWTYAGLTHVSVGSVEGGPTIGDLPAIGIHPGAVISYAVEGGATRTADVGEINDDGTNFLITSDAGSQIAAHNRPSVGTIITVL